MTRPWIGTRSFGCLGFAAAAVLGASRLASAAPTLSVDYDGTAGETASTTPATQSGFTSVTTNSATVGAFTVATTTGAPASGFFTRAGVTNSGAFTEAALYEDFFYAQGTASPTVTISITGVTPATPYTLTFYTYDRSATIGAGPFTTSFGPAPSSNTIGTTGSATYSPGANPPANEADTATITLTSTTGTIDVLASLTTANTFLRINGFTVTPVPEPASLSLLALGSVGLLARRRRVV